MNNRLSLGNAYITEHYIYPQRLLSLLVHTSRINKHANSYTNTNMSTEQSHATNVNDSAVPVGLQKAVPEGAERALPDSVRILSLTFPLLRMLTLLIHDLLILPSLNSDWYYRPFRSITPTPQPHRTCPMRPVLL